MKTKGIDLTKLKRTSLKPWRLRLQIGKRRKMFYFKTERQAKDYFEEHHSIRGQHYKNGKTGDEYYSVGFAIEKWLLEKSREVEAATIKQYKMGAKQLIPIKDMWIHELTLEEIEGALDYSQGKRNQRNYFALHCLDKANESAKRELGFGSELNFVKLKFNHKWRTGVRKKPREYHTIEEVKKISNYFLEKGESKSNSLLMYHIHRIGVLTGARIGEICSFKRYNFFEAEKKLLIDSTLTVDENENLIDGTVTKTGKSRMISLPDEAVESIKFLLAYHKGRYILPKFENTRSKTKYEFCIPSSVNYRMKVACQQLGIIYLATHGSFRKTFATNLYLSTDKNDRDIIAVIQNHLGHASPEMTLHYIQAVNTEIKSDLKRLGSFMAS